MKKVIFSEDTILTKGMKGVAVMILQVMLISKGYGTENLIPDGEYGDETEESLSAYKADCGINGIEDEKGFGPLTMQALKEEDDLDLLLVSYEEEPVPDHE